MRSAADGSTDSGLDLANVPEPMRTAILKQLQKMPAPLREKLLREGSPILDRMIAKAREHAGGAAPLPASAAQSARVQMDASTPIHATPGRYDLASRDRVPTVMPGDSGSVVGWLVTGAIALVAAAWYAMQG
jgi:hypothetical protein